MKKYILTIALTLILVLGLTGCGKKEETESKITCTYKVSDDYTEEIETVTIYHKDNKVTKVERAATTKTTDPELTEEDIDDFIDELNSIGSAYNDVKGFKFEAKKINAKELKRALVIDYTEIDLDEVKDKLGEDYIKETFPNGLDQKADELQKEQFNDYTCE